MGYKLLICSIKVLFSPRSLTAQYIELFRSATCVFIVVVFKQCAIGLVCAYVYNCEFRPNTATSSSSSLGSRCVLWLGEGLSMSSPNYPVLCCPLPYRVALVFVQVVSPPLGWSPLSSFLVTWSPSGDARGPSVIFEAVNMPCPGPFHFLTV